jgi:hypothetical protein
MHSATRSTILAGMVASILGGGCALRGEQRGEATGRLAQASSGACTAVTASVTTAAVANERPTVDMTASAECGGSAAEYRFWVRTQGASWTIVRDWAAGSVATWDTTGAASGVAEIEVDARTAGSLGDYETTTQVSYAVNGGAPACASVTLGASPAGQAQVGAPLALTAAASCDGGVPEYRYWVRTADSDWTIARDYATDAAVSLDTGAYGAGVIALLVDARVVGSNAFFEAQASADYGLTTGPCTAVTLETSPPSAQSSGDPIALTASATCGGAAEYRFWARAPGGAWEVARDFDRDGAFALDTRSFAPGAAAVKVEARGFGAETIEAEQTVSYTIAAARPCSSVVMWGFPEAAQEAGQEIALMAAASCGNNEEYRFWVRAPGGERTLARDYAQDPSLTVDTHAFGAGTATIEVEARLVGGDAAEATSTSIAYAISLPPGSVPSVTASCSRTPCTSDDTVTVAFSALPGNKYDWIGLVPRGEASTSFAQYKYTGGATAGSVAFTGLPAGTTLVPRAFSNNSYTQLGEDGAAIEIASGATPTLTVACGACTSSDVVTVTYASLPGYANDWIAAVQSGRSDAAYQRFVYTGGGVAGSVVLGALPPGTYTARAFANNGGSSIASSATFVITGPRAAAAIAAADGGPGSVTIDFHGMAGYRADWIAIAPAGAGATTYAQYRYAYGAKGGTVTFTGLASGSYVARAFSDDSFTIEAESVPVVVR